MDDSMCNVNQEAFHAADHKFGHSHAFEELYNSMGAADLQNYIGFGSSLSASARSIQNGECFNFLC